MYMLTYTHIYLWANVDTNGWVFRNTYTRVYVYIHMYNYIVRVSMWNTTKVHIQLYLYILTNEADYNSRVASRTSNSQTRRANSRTFFFAIRRKMSCTEIVWRENKGKRERERKYSKVPKVLVKVLCIIITMGFVITFGIIIIAMPKTVCDLDKEIFERNFLEQFVKYRLPEE